MSVENKTVPGWYATDMLFHDIARYYESILLPLGLLGNCLSMCVFFGTKLRYSSCSIYLGALAISDTGFLVSAFISWLNIMHITNLFNGRGFCQFFTYLGTVCGFLSVWLVVAFTVERYIAVRWPLRRQSLCTVSRAKTITMGLTALAIPLCSPVLLFLKSHEITETLRECALDFDWQSWATVYNALDAFITFVVPLTVIVIFNTLIARNIYKQDHVRRTLTIESDASINERNQTSRNRMPQTKVTKMLMVVSSAFFCLNMPSCVFRLLAFIYDNHNPPLWLVLTQRIAYLLFITSFGINFILYCASGQNFRRAMVDMFMRRSDIERNRTFMQTANHGKQYVSEFTRKCNSTKQTHFVDNAHQQSSQEMQKLPLN
ncbi:thyrotropin-releasing hormone receptor [Linepithema humile]|uniref:thyrotropin-releasing hormone receptor n=1 Tax=Linepithema humile TaxID=83485 RepID=UPI0006239483|nr:PREDICTED: thyrotropin-releasing hormone receptor [Linepithema humile]XP_012227982.1 PREDICTED: thyrotropin-releasing hormone receptor [Linepithema humile]XP_012227983.1 PREDICTED: thyrotropin-releasing hormone receptor [Linepithema humile]XP_012227984.1 PREDICTED: thyrotropin-releasing hormone receptor [Linepithema humile]